MDVQEVDVLQHCIVCRACYNDSFCIQTKPVLYIYTGDTHRTMPKLSNGAVVRLVYSPTVAATLPGQLQWVVQDCTLTKTEYLPQADPVGPSAVGESVGSLL